MEEPTVQIEPSEQQQQQPAEDLVRCPCCGKETLHRPVKPPQQVMDAFMACMITGEDFSNDYELFGGRVRITVSRVPDIYEDKIGRIDMLLTDAEKAGLAYNQKLPLMLRGYASIRRIEVSAAANAVFLPSETALKAIDDALAAYASATEGRYEAMLEKLAVLDDRKLVSAVPVPTLIAVVQTHNNLYTLLLETGFDSNFWDRIKLA